MSFSIISAAHAAGAPAAGGSFPPFDATTFPGQLFWFAVTFGLTYILMSRVALPRVGGIIADRRAKVESDLQQAAAAQKSAEDAHAAFEAGLAKAKADAQGIARVARDTVSREGDARRHAVEADLAARLAKAEETINATKAKAMANVESIASEAASAIVERLGGAAPKAADVASALGALAKK